MQAQLAVVVSLHSTAPTSLRVSNQTTAPIYLPPETSSSGPAQDTAERLSPTEKHIQDINLKETASRKVVKNSHTDDIVQALTENGTPVGAMDTKTECIIQHLLVILI